MSEEQPAFEVDIDHCRVKIYADGRVESDSDTMSIGVVINRIPALIAQARIDGYRDGMEGWAPNE